MVVTPESLPRLGRNFRYLAAAGHRHIQVNYSLGVSWAPGAARRFAAALRRLDAWSRARGGAGAVNCTAYRREPVALNSELSCDCDGTLYRETGLCIERDFSAMKERFRVAGAGDKGLNAALLGNTQFDNFYMLTSAYAHDRRLLRLVMNNVGFGRELAGL